MHSEKTPVYFGAENNVAALKIHIARQGAREVLVAWGEN